LTNKYAKNTRKKTSDLDFSQNLVKNKLINISDQQREVKFETVYKKENTTISPFQKYAVH
jgi:hypothetical protein